MDHKLHKIHFDFFLVLEFVVAAGDDTDNEGEDDDALSMNSGTPIYLDQNSDPEEDIVSSNHTGEDFEAIIDSGNSKDGKESNSSVELMEIEADQADEQLITPMNVAVNAAATTTATAKQMPGTKSRLILFTYPQSSVTAASSAKPPQILTMESIGRKSIPASFVPSKNTVYATPSSSNHNLAQYKVNIQKTNKTKFARHKWKNIEIVFFFSFCICEGHVDSNCRYESHIGKQFRNDTCDTCAAG